MKAKDLRQKSEKELKETMNSLEKKAWDSKFGSSSGKIKNVKEMKEIKKDIARILTVLKENISK